jgi:DNA-binding HxlR family transcriptional regulator
MDLESIFEGAVVVILLISDPKTTSQVHPVSVHTHYLECSFRLAPMIKLFYTEAMPKRSSVPSVLDPRCPSRLVLDRIADKWTALVIQILSGGTMRYAALQREIGGISQKMLTQTLRSLERDGLVHRTVHPVVPPKVEYSLTRLGRTLIEPLQGLCRWSEKHLAELQANRARANAVAASVDRGK